jgi:predicted nucleic acid-binding protein
VDSRKVRAFIDTNVLLVGAVNLALGEQTAEVKVIRRLLKGEVKMVTSLKQLEELTVASRRVLGRDFAGWIRYLILTQINPLIIREQEYSETERKYANQIPNEDLTHFAVAVAGKAQYLISENHEFLKKAAECKTIKCVTSTEFLKKIESK